MSVFPGGVASHDIANLLAGLVSARFQIIWCTDYRLSCQKSTAVLCLCCTFTQTRFVDRISDIRSHFKIRLMHWNTDLSAALLLNTWQYARCWHTSFGARDRFGGVEAYMYWLRTRAWNCRLEFIVFSQIDQHAFFTYLSVSPDNFTRCRWCQNV